MIDHPPQFLLAVAVLAVAAGYLWRTRRSRLAHRPVGWRKAGRWLARCIILLLMLMTLLLALEATRYMTADVCLEFQAGSEWCLHDTAGSD
jgi:hypothetical protein